MSSDSKTLEGPEIPPLLAPPGLNPRSLPEEINSATRKTHTHLNRLITARLPLAVPPFASDPSTYLLGISHFAPVYRTFESLWDKILAADPPAVAIDSLRAQDLGSDESTTRLHPKSQDGLPPDSLPSRTVRIRSILAHLKVKSLDRATCLDNDISLLTVSFGQEMPRKLSSPDRPRLAEFTQHIEQAVADDPYLLIAYSWILYMALFSGGRWIREQLYAAGPGFWQGVVDLDQRDTSETTRANEKDTGSPIQGVSFLSFPPDTNDGLDLKDDYRARLVEIESLLTISERQNIVAEALKIFRFLVLLVEELDSLAGPPSLLQRIGTLPLYSRPAATSPTRRRSSIAKYFSWASSSSVSRKPAEESDNTRSDDMKNETSKLSGQSHLKKHVRWTKAVEELEYPVQQPSLYVIVAIVVACIGLVSGLLFWSKNALR